jgi:hypothetical protein
MSVEEELELRRMQEDAVNRAREMQRRSHIPQSETEVSSDMPPGMSSETSAGVSPATPETPSELPFAEIPPEPSEDVLDGLFQDKDRTLILMLLVLISGEDASNELMFALLFLLM